MADEICLAERSGNIAQTHGVRIGVHNGVGAVAAPEVRMALGPAIAVVLRREEPAELGVRHTRLQTQMWNHDTWCCAIRYVVAQIGVDWGKACAVPHPPDVTQPPPGAK